MQASAPTNPGSTVAIVGRQSRPLHAYVRCAIRLLGPACVGPMSAEASWSISAGRCGLHPERRRPPAVPGRRHEAQRPVPRRRKQANGRAADIAARLMTWVSVRRITAQSLARTRREAPRLSREACRLRATYGPGSRLEGQCFEHRGEYLLAMGSGAALTVFERSLTILGKSHRPGHHHVAFPLTGIGPRALLVSRSFARGSRIAGARLRVRTAGESGRRVEGRDRGFALAEALWATGDKARATRWRRPRRMTTRLLLCTSVSDESPRLLAMHAPSRARTTTSAIVRAGF